MIVKPMHALWMAGFLAGVAGAPLHAQDFAAPAEGPLAFRRDQLPLEADAMARISQQLVTLTGAVDMQTAAGRRGVAQMLALASALDPANLDARKRVADLQAGGEIITADAEQISKARALVWQYLGWLETPDAGEPGRALAACLADVMTMADPQHPKTQARRGAPERGVWAGWIPEVAAYEAGKSKLAATEMNDETLPADPEPSAAETPGALLTEAEISLVLWRELPKSVPPTWLAGPARLEMSAENLPTENGKKSPFSLLIEPHAGNSAFRELVKPLTELLQNHHGSLPANTRVTVGGKALEESLRSKKRHSLSAAVAVLASAAISGREPDPDLTILGALDAKGAFQLPTGFWDQLHALGKGDGKRLVVPAAAAEELTAMLALERPEFFFEFEVLLAENFEQLVQLADQAPSEKIAASAMKFREIREKAARQPIGQYLANSFVARRLAELAQEAPYHFSAKMLAVQGAGNRPVTVPRRVMVSELRRAIAPMEWLVVRQNGDLDKEDFRKIGTSFDDCRTGVDRLMRYAEKGDRDMIEQVQTMLNSVRALDRATRARGEAYLVTSGVNSARLAVVKAHGEIAKKLAIAAGETE